MFPRNNGLNRSGRAYPAVAALQGIPGANAEQLTTLKSYIEAKVAANRDFVERLLRAKAFRIQVESFQSQLKAASEDTHQLGAKIASAFKAG